MRNLSRYDVTPLHEHGLDAYVWCTIMTRINIRGIFGQVYLHPSVVLMVGEAFLSNNTTFATLDTWTTISEVRIS